MRTIKFRGLRKDGKGWVYGSLSIEFDDSCFISFWVPKLVNPEINYSELVHKNHEVLSKSVGQFTGILDKNGKDLYEGDILKGYKEWDGSPFVVEFKQHHGNHEVGYVHGFAMPDKGLEPFHYEIIGNIYETR